MVFRLVYSFTYNWLVTNQPECGRKSDDNHNFKFISVKTWSKICPVRTVKATCLHSPLLSHSHVPYQNECSALWHPNYQLWNLFTYRYTGMLHLVSSLNSIVVSFSVFCFHFVSVIRHQVAKVARVAISVHIYLTRREVPEPADRRLQTRRMHFAERHGLFYYRKLGSSSYVW